MRKHRWTVLGIVTVALLASCASGPAARAGLLRSVLCVDGQSGYVEVPYSKGLDISESLTLEAWIKAESFLACTGADDTPEPYCTYSPVVSQPNPTSAIGNYLLAVAKDTAVFGFEPSEETDVRMDAPMKLTSGWHHIAAVHVFGRQGATRLFFDGAVVGEWVSEDRRDLPAYPNPGTPYLIGRLGVPKGYFHGMIDEVRIWCVARTAEQIRATMNAELRGDETGLIAYWKFDEPTDSLVAHDSSPNGNDGVLRRGAQIHVSQTSRQAAPESR